MTLTALIETIPACLGYAMMNEPIVSIDIQWTSTECKVAYVKSVTFPNGKLTRLERGLHSNGIVRNAYVLTCNGDVLAVFEMPPVHTTAG